MNIQTPFPPSVNHYWGSRVVGSGKRRFVQRFVDKPGKQFKRTVAEIWLFTPGETLVGPLACRVDLYPPDARRRDVDNYCKSLLDALGDAGVYEDDSQIVDLHIRMHPKTPPGKAQIRLETLAEQQTNHNQIGLI